MTICLLLAAALSAGNAEFERTATTGAADVVMARARRELVRQGPAAGILTEAMLSDPAACEKRADAERFCRVKYEAALEAALAARAASVKERLGLPEAPDASLEADARAEAMKHFAAAFERERGEACAAQAKKIASRVKPSENDIGVKSEEMLRAELVAGVVGEQRAVVFEENRKYISDTIVEPILAAAKKELTRQREYLMRTKCDAYAPTALAKELEANLAKNVAERRAKAGGDPSTDWGVFPVVVRDAVPVVAERRTLERVRVCIDDVPVAVDVAAIRGRIAADRGAHRKAEDSERVFRDAFAAQVTDGAREKVVAEAPAAERAEFAEYVKERGESPILAKAVEARVRRELMPQLRRVRGEIAAEDAKALWPALMDGTWFPEPALADDFAARADYAKCVRRWRDSPQLAALAGAAEGKTLLEETDRIADVKVAKAFELARSAINAQNAVVDEVVPGVLAEARARKDSLFSRTPDLKAVVGLLTEAVDEKWGGVRETVLWNADERPANAADQHRALYPSVRRRIELVARTILEEMNKPEPQPEEKPPEPEEKPVVETPPEEKPPEEPKYVISVQRRGETVEVKLLEGQKPLVEKSAKAEMPGFRGAMDALTETLGREFLKLK